MTAGRAGTAAGTYSYISRLPGFEPKLDTRVRPAACAGGDVATAASPAVARTAAAATDQRIRLRLRDARMAASCYRAAPHCVATVNSDSSDSNGVRGHNR